MDVPPPAPEASATPPAAGSSRRRWFHRLLPHLITAVVSVAISLGAQTFFFTQAEPIAVVPTSTPQSPAPTLVATLLPTAMPPTALPLAPGISQQELADIRAEGDRKQAQIYLLLAIVQIDSAETALHNNDLNTVGQSLVAIDNSLNLAYTRYDLASDSARDAIAQRRSEVGKMHDDLFLYPEGMDTRLNTLRQLTLALITEQRH